jgi:hypothetical protein
MKNSGMKNLLIVFAFVMIIIPLALMLMKTIFGITLGTSEGFSGIKNATYPSIGLKNQYEGFASTGCGAYPSGQLTGREGFEDVKVPSIPLEYKQKRFGSNMLPCRSPDGQSSCPEGTFCENSSSSCQSITVKGSSDVVGYFS